MSTRIIGNLIKEGLALEEKMEKMEELEGLFKHLDELETAEAPKGTSIEGLRYQDTESGIDVPEEYKNSVLTIAHNAMTADMKEIQLFAFIEATQRDRAVIIHATWSLSAPKEPSKIVIDYLLDFNEFKNRRIQASREFRNREGQYCKRDFDLGLIRATGHSQLHKPGGVADIVYGTFGRNALSIIGFLQGYDKYKAQDLTYNNEWGAW